MEKLTLHDLGERNEWGKKEDGWTKAVVVFTPESFSKTYTEQERSYEVRSDAKYFDWTKLGNSLYGNCLDGTDDGVRLDLYLSADNGWTVDYCYIVE